jgi:DNA topoisomerase I
MPQNRSKWWRRIGSKEQGFRYVDAAGKALRGSDALARIKSLVIPPAWTDVLIAPSAGAKVQAVGKDSIGRTQYIYHEGFAQKRQSLKFAKLIEFAKRLPLLRKKTKRDIKQDGLTKDRVLAVIVRLINDLYFRVGSEKSVKQYKTFGITTLRKRHVEITDRGEIVFNFVGKHHIRHERVLRDKSLAQIIRDLKSIGRTKLFNYVDDDGKIRPVTPRDVNDYIQRTTEAALTAKDFRTWGATLNAAKHLAEIGATRGERSIKKNIVRAVRAVAEHLGNTVAVARNSYVHPGVIKKYERGITLETFRIKAKQLLRRNKRDFDVEELALIQMLKS